MKLPLTYKTLSVIVVFAMASLGCDLFTQETPQPLATATVQPTATIQSTIALQPTIPVKEAGQSTPQPTQGNASLSSSQKQQLAHATVRITLLQKVNGKLQTIGTGSGTILSPDGMILTNCHVADPALIGDAADQPDELGIEIVDTEDQPPVPSYFAKVLAADGTLDLAVIQIDRMLDGTPVKPGSLNLPYVNIGDSDKVKFGDPIYVFGFPGIGGDTITYTSGSVSGFDSMDPLGIRAWIKTDATIAGGNSGGLATNTDGEIIGVPTRLGTSSAARVTDCRVIADTNGDGVIDNNDTCVPTGGFINAIRPIKWALSMIKSSQTNVAYVSPYDQPQIEPTRQSSASEDFALNNWSTAIDSDNCPVQPVTSFPSGTQKIYAVFKFKNMTSDEDWSRRWLYDQREIISTNDTWSYETSRSCLALTLSNGRDPLPDGTYEVQIYAGADLNLAGSAQVEVGGKGSNAPQVGSYVTVKGKVVDANTGKGLANMYVIVLNPGVDPDNWIDNGTDADIYTYTQTDSKGFFSLPDTLARGDNYATVVGNADSDYRNVIGSIDVTDSTPDLMNITIEMSK